MFRKNQQHLQPSLFSDLNALSAKQRTRLEESWAGAFRREVFNRLDEQPLAVLYSDEPSRPNVPVNVLLGLETLKAGFGWSDAELYDEFVFNLQVRYALGYDRLSDGEFDLRTVYNFRRRLSEYQQSQGKNLVEQAFVQVTDEQVRAFQLKTGHLRMDTTQISSNIRQMNRLQLLVEMLQRVDRMLSAADQARYAEALAPYRKGSSGQYVYHLKGEDTAPHLQRIGEVMQRLLDELAPAYAQEATYQLLARMFQEQFTVAAPPPPAPARVASDLPIRPEPASAPDAAPVSGPPGTGAAESAAPTARPKVQTQPGQAIRADSLRSPDDPDATYRKKAGHAYQGYVANVTETCDPDNPLQLIVQTQVAANTTQDTDLLRAAVPDLKTRLDVEHLYTDGGFCSPDVDDLLRDLRIEQTPTGLCGHAPRPDRLSLADFRFEGDDPAAPERVVCPHGRAAEVEPGRNAERFLARFVCDDCPLATRCSTQVRTHDPRRVLPFSHKDLGVTLRRQRRAQHPEAKNVRAAVEATVGALKRPFPEDQLPVRGGFRMACLVIGSAWMVNVRRIQRYRANLRRKARQATRAARLASGALRLVFVSLWTQVQRFLRPPTRGLAASAFSC